MSAGETLAVFLPADNEPPASDFATLDTRNGHQVLDFAVGESAVFCGVMPRNYAGNGIVVTLFLSSEDVGGDGDTYNFSAAVEALAAADQDVDSDGFATAIEGTEGTVPNTAGVLANQEIALDGTEADSVAASDMFRLKITRIASSQDDNDIELHGIEIREAAA